jgi:site-specific recombinase XerC
MHSCGLRTAETRLLRPEHVHLRDRNLDIVASKGNRSRRLPITDERVVDTSATAVTAQSG